MNYTTIPPKKATPTTTSKEPYSPKVLTFNDLEGNDELTPSEQALWERFEAKHLAYSDFDLHY